MRRNLIFMYLIYFLIIYLLCIIDITILIYYIFWINNIFIIPFFWLLVKIVYYNRTILLLLFFYYLLAKFSIKESGYKYVYFFKIDVKRWRSIYINYIWDITIYHIEIISIILFLIVIVLPLFLHNKEIGIVIIFSFLFIFLFFKLFQHKLTYLKNKKIKLKELLILWILIWISLKVLNHNYFKDIIMTYMHLDKFAFNLLEWKIQMYNKIMAKDYLYYQTVGLKPKWVGNKINIEKLDVKKEWLSLYKQKKFNFWDAFKEDFLYQYGRNKYKYYLYIKYYEKVGRVKNEQVNEEYTEIKENIALKKKTRVNIYKDVKEFTPKIRIKKENPVVTQEKAQERALHQKVLLNKNLKFSLKNYYDLNLMLKNLTLKTLYYQPFIDKKINKKEYTNENKGLLLVNIKEKIKNKDDYKLYNNIIKKIIINQKTLNNKVIMDSNKLNSNIEQNKDNYYIIDKLLSYLKIDKKNEKEFKNFFKNLKTDKKNEKNIKNIKKKEKIKLSMKLFFKKVNNNFEFNKKIDKYSVVDKAKEKILKNDTFKKKKKGTYYIKKEEEEQVNKQLLFSTVKKYTTEKKNISLKKEFNDVFYKKENKTELKQETGPDLSRRQRR